MEKKTIIVLILCVFISTICMAQAKKTGTTPRKSATTQKRTTPQKKTTASAAAFKDDAEISVKGHVDYLTIGEDGEAIHIAKNIKADYIFKVYRDPTDRMRPGRKTVILTCDIDWKALGEEGSIPVDWSWSSRQINIVTQEEDGYTGYAVMDGNKGVAVVIPRMKRNGKVADFVFLYGGGSQLTGLRQGMHIDDVARQIQAEIPGTRVVITGNKQNGLNEYVLQSFGENKVYDVTGDYHYELNNTTPYFTFWTDSKDKLVKWFKLK